MSKRELEEEKLQLEVAELKKSWLKKPDVLRVLLPTSLAIFSLIYAISSGLFSSKQEILELRKRQVEFEIQQFEKEKKELIVTNADLNSTRLVLNDSLVRQSQKLAGYEEQLQFERDEISNLKNNLTVLRNTRNTYNLEIDSLEKSYVEKKRTYLKEIESKYFQELDFKKEIEKLTFELRVLENRSNFHEYNAAILRSNPFIKLDDKMEFLIYEGDRMMQYSDSIDIINNKELNRLELLSEKYRKKTDSIQVKSKIRKIE